MQINIVMDALPSLYPSQFSRLDILKSIAIPFAILDVNGIPIKIKNAGNASSNSFN